MSSNDIHLMLDLETAGVSSDAAILSIGAVLFSREGEVIAEYYQAVDLESSVQCGGKIDASTFLWWLQQSQEARDAISAKGKQSEPLFLVLDDFSAWVRDFSPVDVKDVKIWGNGATFDIVILKAAFERCSITWRFSFWNERCFRTLLAENPKTVRVKPELAHHALSDAKAQMYTLFNIWGVGYEKA